MPSYSHAQEATVNWLKRTGSYGSKLGINKRAAPKSKSTPPIDHNGLYPYLLRFTEWGAVKGLSDATVKTRDRSLRRFIVWCDERSIDDPKAITRPILERYQKHL